MTKNLKADNMLNESRKFALRQNEEVMNLLLKDQTTKKNIIWATDNYSMYGKDFYPENQIKFKYISHKDNAIIQPRMKKHSNTQITRTKDKAEVFTPVSTVFNQNEMIDRQIRHLDLESYIRKIWLEITCGEAPYICSRYDAVDGSLIDLPLRVGFLDKKLQRISSEINSKSEWEHYLMVALKSCYGYEYHGDSLLIARENLLFTVIDYYYDKFGVLPEVSFMKECALVISHNIFQMDGMTNTIPFSREVVIREGFQQLNFFEEETVSNYKVIKEGKKVKIFDWDKNKSIYFESLINR